MTTFTEALQIIAETIAKDKIYMDAAHQALAKTGLFEHALTIRKYKGLPETIAAVECAIFDNWGSDTKPKGSKDVRFSKLRHGVTIKAWKVGTKFREQMSNPNSQLTGFFMDGPELLALVNRLTKKGEAAPISADYAAYLTDLAAGLGDDLKVAALAAKAFKQGTVYQEFQFVIVSVSALNAKASCDGTVKLAANGKVIKLAGLRNTSAQDNALTGNCILQSRSANTDLGWKSGEATGLDA